jgi:putative MFS transporter
MTDLVPARRAWAAILAAGLGYFVDIFDLLLLSVLRVSSLKELKADPFAAGLLLQNVQLVGMMVGGVVWGMLGDRRGRLTVLFGSIFLYSAATLANAFVGNMEQYLALRFVAGFGLAGELGAGLTLVSELVEPRARGVATTLVATLGVLGAVAAALVAELVGWRTAYILGGVMGFALFALRLGIAESGMFKRRENTQRRGDFRRLFATRERALRYLRAILIGVPIWYAVPILITFAPEFARALGTTDAIVPGRAVLAFYLATTFGDLSSGLLSQKLHSRRKAIGVYLGLLVLGVPAYMLLGMHGATAFYAGCAWLGFATGYWAVTVSAAVEQFGTDLRATVGTSVPTFIRVTGVPMTLAFQALRPALGIVPAACSVGAVAFVLAFWALAHQPETYARDLDFVE